MFHRSLQSSFVTADWPYRVLSWISFCLFFNYLLVACHLTSVLGTSVFLPTLHVTSIQEDVASDFADVKHLNCLQAGKTVPICERITSCQESNTAQTLRVVNFEGLVSLQNICVYKSSLGWELWHMHRISGQANWDAQDFFALVMQVLKATQIQSRIPRCHVILFLSMLWIDVWCRALQHQVKDSGRQIVVLLNEQQRLVGNQASGSRSSTPQLQGFGSPSGYGSRAIIPVSNGVHTSEMSEEISRHVTFTNIQVLEALSLILDCRALGNWASCHFSCAQTLIQGSDIISVP